MGQGNPAMGGCRCGGFPLHCAIFSRNRDPPSVRTRLPVLPGDIASVPGDVALMTKVVANKGAVCFGKTSSTDIRIL